MTVRAVTKEQMDYARQIPGNTVVLTPTWIQKYKKQSKSGKTEDRLLVVGKYNIFTVKESFFTGSLAVAKSAHIYDIQSMGHLPGQGM